MLARSARGEGIAETKYQNNRVRHQGKHGSETKRRRRYKKQRENDKTMYTHRCAPYGMDAPLNIFV